MYKDYLDAIVWHYKQIKSKSELPQRLLRPSPSKIRDECASVYNSRYLDRKDRGTLNTFFELTGEINILKAIKKFELGKFKPLANFLNGETNSTEAKNIELLGWLLDYPNRPFNESYNYQDEMIKAQDCTKNLETFIGEIESHQMLFVSAEEVAGKNQSMHDGNRRSNNIKKIFIENKWRLVTGILIILGAGGAFLFRNRSSDNKFGSFTPSKKECMVWNDDHYELVSCDSFNNGKDVWPIKVDRLNNFRRITRPDTITEKDIRSIWYIKRSKDSLDLFTDAGKDPLNPTRYLNPLTTYMYEKYLLNKYH